MKKREYNLWRRSLLYQHTNREVNRAYDSEGTVSRDDLNFTELMASQHDKTEIISLALLIASSERTHCHRLVSQWKQPMKV